MFQVKSNNDKRIEIFACGGQDSRERSWKISNDYNVNSSYCKKETKNIKNLISAGVDYRIIARKAENDNYYVR